MRTRRLSKMFSILFVFCCAIAVVSPAQTFTTLVSFGGPNGAEPRYGSLVVGADGNFYGTTRGGGAHSRGTVFKMTSSGTLTTLYSFCSQSNCSDGGDPDAGLVLGSDGNFYGVTTGGGASGDGTVFKVSPSGSFTSLHSFIGTDGYDPVGTLLQASDGNFYGTTMAEGGHGSGTIFKITSNGTLTTIYNFCSLGACADGGTPFAGLVQGTDGNLYGTTSSGGQFFLYGTVYKIALNGTVGVLHSFDASDGSAPYAKLVQASDGNFYGTTSSGGGSQNCTFGCGTAFKVTPGGGFTLLHSFNQTDGSYIIAGLIQASDGNFYGVAGDGGSNCSNCGTIFKMTPAGTLTVVHNFAGFPTEGSLPVAALLQASDGTFYGTAEAGGSVGDGAVFSLTGPPVPSTTAVTSTPNPSQAGEAVTLTATVSPSGATGTVDFTSNGAGISGCTAVTLNSGTAVCTTSGLAVGTDAIVATYSGDDHYGGSMGTLAQIVNPVPVALQFVPLTPCRVVDTRNANGPFGGPAIGGHSSRDFPLSRGDNPCDIPSDAIAYSLNVTVVPQGALGYLTIWPTGEGQPTVSTLNSLDGRVKANAAIIPAGTPNGSVSVYVTNTTDVVLDIDGYFIPSSGQTLAFYPLPPCRVADTRNPNGPLGGPYLHAGVERDFPVQSSTCQIPPTAAAYSLNFTAIPKGSHLGYLTVWAKGSPQPVVSTLNDPTGTVVANAALVPAGNGGAIATYANNDTNLVIDVNGYFAPAGSGGLSFYALTPCRVIDTRSVGNGQPFSGKLIVNVVDSACGPPATSAGYVFNATVIPQGPLGFLTLWPDSEPQPVVSTLNAVDGAVTSNMAIVPNSNGKTDAWAQGTTQLILDISGYFAP
jgi:uncharacterized repeat protein (TIGR03803 family)